MRHAVKDEDNGSVSQLACTERSCERRRFIELNHKSICACTAIIKSF